MISCDASTLILLARTELLEKFLDSFHGEVLIPAEVQRECCVKKSLDALLSEKAIREGRITVRRFKESRLSLQIRNDFMLGKGEAEAIALALSAKAKLLGIDDKRGINACKLLKLQFTTAIDILLRMREKGLIEKQAALLKLAALERYGRYGSAIVEDARRKLRSEERRVGKECRL